MLRVALGAACGLSLALLPLSANADPAGYTDCQSLNTLPGISVHDLHNITGSAACKVALQFYKWWEERGERGERFYICHGPGKATLTVRKFDNWSLSWAETNGFVMTRGRQSFAQIGQDYPFVCF